MTTSAPRTADPTRWGLARFAVPFSLLALSATAAGACAAGSDTPSGQGGSGGSSASGTSSSAGGSGQGGTSFDAGDQDGDLGASCQYVDLLFVIDNSPSMGPYQEDLAQAFPAFVDAMYDSLPSSVDLHVGITTTSFFTGSCSESVSNCVSQASPQEIDDHYTKPTEGSTNVNGEQGRLFAYAGMPFFSAKISDPDRAPLKTWFAEAAVAAGETGCSFEMASAAAGYAAHPANAAANAGFFRDEDGVLLVVVLSDEPDKSPEGTQVYKDMLTGVKSACGGDACILTAGLVDPCIETVNNPLWGFLNAFGEPPIWADLDDPTQYTNVVGDALAQVVKQTCDEIAVPK